MIHAHWAAPPEGAGLPAPGSGRAARRRLLTVLFVLSVALPVSWGLSAGSARAEENPLIWPVAPETTDDLLALAAVAPQRRQPFAAEKNPSLALIAPSPERLDTQIRSATPTLTEYYARAPHTLRSLASKARETKRLPTLLAQAASGPEASEPSLPAGVRIEGLSKRPELPLSLYAQRAPAPPTRPVLLAQAAPTRVSAASLLRQSAAAPQLSAVGAATSRTARDAANGRSPLGNGRSPLEAGAGRGADRSGPVPATRREIEQARRERAPILAGAAPRTTPRRRVAMHRVAAAAASSLNEATPFRTAGSGTARFSGAQAGESLSEGLDRAAEAVSVVPGLRLENVELTAGYSSNGLPGARNLGGGADSQLGSDTDFRGAATLAYRKRFRTGALGLSYTPSRMQRNRFSQWNSTDHIVGLNVNRQLGRRWGLAMNASAANTGLEQFWFRQPTLRRVENPPTSFDELLQRVDAGEFTDEEFASILTGAPIVEDPGGRELDLARVTSLSSGVTASYARSARSDITFGASTSRFSSSFVTGANDRSNRPQVNELSRHSAFVQSTYRRDAATTMGVRVNTGLNDSSFGEALSSSATVYVNRRLSRFWSAQVEGGGGYVAVDTLNPQFARAQGGNSRGQATWVAGGQVNYRYGGHRFGSSIRRSVGDSMGLASMTTLSAGLDWQWTNPRMPWVFNGGATFMRSDWGAQVFDATSTAFESTLLQGAVTRRLTPTTALTTGYYFGRYDSPLRGLLTGVTVHRVQASFLWRPAESR